MKICKSEPGVHYVQFTIIFLLLLMQSSTEILSIILLTVKDITFMIMGIMHIEVVITWHGAWWILSGTLWHCGHVGPTRQQVTYCTDNSLHSMHHGDYHRQNRQNNFNLEDSCIVNKYWLNRGELKLPPTHSPERQASNINTRLFDTPSLTRICFI